MENMTFIDLARAHHKILDNVKLGKTLKDISAVGINHDKNSSDDETNDEATNKVTNCISSGKMIKYKVSTGYSDYPLNMDIFKMLPGVRKLSARHSDFGYEDCGYSRGKYIYKYREFYIFCSYVRGDDMNVYEYETNDYIIIPPGEGQKDKQSDKEYYEQYVQMLNSFFNICHEDEFDYLKFLNHTFNEYDLKGSDLRYTIDFFRNSKLNKRSFLQHMEQLYDED